MRRRNGSAKAPGDYKAASGTLTFAPGETQKTVSVTVVGDNLNEADDELLADPFVAGQRGRRERGDRGRSRHKTLPPSASTTSVNEWRERTVASPVGLRGQARVRLASGQTVTLDYAHRGREW